MDLKQDLQSNSLHFLVQEYRSLSINVSHNSECTAMQIRSIEA